ncbi:MAG: hypothetical protein M0C28_35120 [Candidatus Moduliflexus flocculans]|nr:hypothetical protein [Candidatus Moduliflexus flocculans]
MCECGEAYGIGSLLPYSQQQAVGIQKWRIEALVFSTNFRLGFEPAEFQTILPKNLIHRVVPGEPMYDFFEAWKRSAAETAAAKIYGTASMVPHAAAERLSARGMTWRSSASGSRADI